MSARVLDSLTGYHAFKGLNEHELIRRVASHMRTPSVLAVVLALTAPAHATPIPNDPFAAPVPTFVGAPATPRSLPAPAVPQHPFMAPNGRSNIHDDAYQTDTYVGLGPLGRNPEVLSTQQNAAGAAEPQHGRATLYTAATRTPT